MVIGSRRCPPGQTWQPALSFLFVRARRQQQRHCREDYSRIQPGEVSLDRRGDTMLPRSLETKRPAIAHRAVRKNPCANGD